MPRLRSAIFRTGDGQVAKFLMDNFGFTKTGKYLEQKRDTSLGTAIELEEDAKYKKLKNNVCYWKMGVLMPDVQQMTTTLKSGNVIMDNPSQFLDIGFLVHTSDPDGNTYELLQHTFQSNFKGPHRENPVTVGQITIRTRKLDETMAFYCKKLGMKLLSVQPVREYGFTLYFLGYTSDTPPNASNPEAIENREWLWGKPYCTIEIQHVKKEIAPYEDLKQDEKGWAGMRITATKQEAKSLMGIETSTLMRDPNNIPVHVDLQ